MKKISFVTNTAVNTLSNVKLLLKSLKENLKSQEHEILVFVDSDNENTVGYLNSVKDDFHDLKIITHALKPCVGYQRNNNILVEKASHDVVSYLQSDMVVCKNYDAIVLEELEENMILSATRIEPPLHGESPVTITENLGLNAESFDMKRFLEFSEFQKEDKEIPFFFAPITFHKKTWLSIGGYDTRFRRSREDTDFLMRALKAGIDIKQTFKANVYHFTCISSRGKNWYEKNNKEAQERLRLQNIADSIEMSRFIRKWGNFSHGEIDLVKYDIDFVYGSRIEDDVDISYIRNIEPFVSRVWVRTEEDRRKIVNSYKGEHIPANNLLHFGEEDWENNKRFYNEDDIERIYCVGEPETFNAKISPRGTEKNAEIGLSGIHQSIQLMEPGQHGLYELGGYWLQIMSAVDLTENILKVENPPFDDSLIFIG